MFLTRILALALVFTLGFMGCEPGEEEIPGDEPPAKTLFYGAWYDVDPNGLDAQDQPNVPYYLQIAVGNNNISFAYEGKEASYGKLTFDITNPTWRWLETSECYEIQGTLQNVDFQKGGWFDNEPATLTTADKAEFNYYKTTIVGMAVSPPYGGAADYKTSATIYLYLDQSGYQDVLYLGTSGSKTTYTGPTGSSGGKFQKAGW